MWSGLFPASFLCSGHSAFKDLSKLLLHMLLIAGERISPSLLHLSVSNQCREHEPANSNLQVWFSPLLPLVHADIYWTRPLQLKPLWFSHLEGHWISEVVSVPVLSLLRSFFPLFTLFLQFHSRKRKNIELFYPGCTVPCENLFHISHVKTPCSLCEYIFCEQKLTVKCLQWLTYDTYSCTFVVKSKRKIQSVKQKQSKINTVWTVQTNCLICLSGDGKTSALFVFNDTNVLWE